MIPKAERKRCAWPGDLNRLIDLKEYLVEVPSVARSRRYSSQVVGISLAELKAPFTDGFVSEDDAAHRKHLFNIAEAQGKAEI